MCSCVLKYFSSRQLIRIHYLTVIDDHGGGGGGVKEGGVAIRQAMFWPISQEKEHGCEC